MYRPHLQVTLSEKSVSNYRSTLWNIPE